MRLEALRQSHGNVELAICRLFSGHFDDGDAQQGVINIDGDDSGSGGGSVKKGSIGQTWAHHSNFLGWLRA